MAGEEKASFVGDIRKLLQDVVTPDLKALVTRMDALEKEFRESKSEVKERFAEVKEQFAEVKEQFAEVKEQFRELRQELHDRDERIERRFDRVLNALDTYKDVQELKEFRIRMEERQKLSA